MFKAIVKVPNWIRNIILIDVKEEVDSYGQFY